VRLDDSRPWEHPCDARPSPPVSWRHRRFRLGPDHRSPRLGGRRWVHFRAEANRPVQAPTQVGRSNHPNLAFPLRANSGTVGIKKPNSPSEDEVNSTVMADPTSEETTARSASLVVLGDTWLTTFCTNPRGGTIGRELMRCHTRLVQNGHSRRCTTATRSGRVPVMTVDSSGEASTACLAGRWPRESTR
jgi:hypothetical protein